MLRQVLWPQGAKRTVWETRVTGYFETAWVLYLGMNGRVRELTKCNRRQVRQGCTMTGLQNPSHRREGVSWGLSVETP